MILKRGTYKQRQQTASALVICCKTTRHLARLRLAAHVIRTTWWFCDAARGSQVAAVFQTIFAGYFCTVSSVRLCYLNYTIYNATFFNPLYGLFCPFLSSGFFFFCTGSDSYPLQPFFKYICMDVYILFFFLFFCTWRDGEFSWEATVGCKGEIRKPFMEETRRRLRKYSGIMTMRKLSFQFKRIDIAI